MPDALFDVDPVEQPVKLTGAARRRQRQAECLAAGLHPLVAALRGMQRSTIHLHPNAAPAGDRNAPGLRCGTCAYRQVPNREVAGRYPKCAFGGRWHRATGGPGTDIAAWFPACTDYEDAGAQRRKPRKRSIVDVQLPEVVAGE